MDSDGLAAGRETDALVATLVMEWWHEATSDTWTSKWTLECWGASLGVDGGFWPLPAFSTDPTAAEQIVEKLRADGWSFRLDQDGTSRCARFFRQTPGGADQVSYASADSVPLAICRAALRTAAS